MDKLLHGVVIIAICCAGCGAPGPSSGAGEVFSAGIEGFNVIMISLDTLRADHLGSYGLNRAVSPFMDRFSWRCFVFADVMAQSSSTMHSHRSLFTSTYTRKAIGHLPAPDETMAGILKASGRRTAAFADGGMMSKNYGLSPGFDLYDSRLRLFKRISAASRDWLEEFSREPFFLFMHTYEIHAPYDPPSPYDRIFQTRTDPQHLEQIKALSANIYSCDFARASGEFTAIIENLYDGGIRYTDMLLERFFRYLHDRGILENRIVILISDHGESLGERAIFGHNRLYQVQLQVPLLIYVPRSAGRIVAGSFQNIDILPTVMSMLNIDPGDRRLEGTDLTPWMLGKVPPEYGRFRMSEVKKKALHGPDNWKYILAEDGSKDELYHLSDDPYEKHNLLDRHSEISDRMRKIIARKNEVDPAEIRTFVTNKADFVLKRTTSRDKKSYNERRKALERELRKLGYID